MALFENTIVHPDEGFLPYRNSRNSKERDLFALVKDEHRLLLTIPSESNVNGMRDLMSAYTDAIKQNLEELSIYVASGDDALEKIVNTAIYQLELSFAAALELLQAKAHYDSLTQIHNRGSFDYVLRERVSECLMGTKQSAFGLIFIDLAHFGGLNTAFGEQIGDEILRVVANTLRPRELKGLSNFHDKPSRTGGDEFAVLLSFTTTQVDEEKGTLPTQIRDFKTILKRISVQTNLEFNRFIDDKIDSGVITRKALENTIHGMYGKSKDFSPRVRLGGVLVTTSGHAHQYVVSKNQVLQMNSLDSSAKSPRPLTANTIDGCCEQVIKLAKDAVALVKEHEKTSRSCP